MRDAHNHLHDARLAPHRTEILEACARLGISKSVPNGTREDDWLSLAELCSRHPDTLLPSFGLHPWYVSGASPDWRAKLIARLDAYPGAGVGEIGLDRWIEPHDFPAQLDAFTWQLDLGIARNLPVTIHCLKAWGALWEILRTRPVHRVLLHSYGGPLEMVEGFVRQGAYFSFSPYFLHERKASQRAVFAQIPLDRLLIETDAPDMAPPPERNAHPLSDEHGKAINHPANLSVAYEGLAALRQMPLETLSGAVAENFEQLFGPPRR